MTARNFISPSLGMSPSFKEVAASLSATLRWITPLGFGFGLLMHKDFLPLGGTPQQASASVCLLKAPALHLLKALLCPLPGPYVPVFSPVSQPPKNSHPTQKQPRPSLSGDACQCCPLHGSWDSNLCASLTG